MRSRVWLGFFVLSFLVTVRSQQTCAQYSFEGDSSIRLNEPFNTAWESVLNLNEKNFTLQVIVNHGGLDAQANDFPILDKSILISEGASKNIPKTSYSLYLRRSDGKAVYSFTGMKPELESSVPVPSNVPTQLTISYSTVNRTLTMTVDDGTNSSSVSSSNQNGAGAPVDGPLIIGGNVNNNFFRGAIRELRLWNFELSPLRITELRKDCVFGNETGLIGYWRLDDNTTTLLDSVRGLPGRIVTTTANKTITWGTGQCFCRFPRVVFGATSPPTTTRRSAASALSFELVSLLCLVFGLFVL